MHEFGVCVCVCVCVCVSQCCCHGTPVTNGACGRYSVAVHNSFNSKHHFYSNIMLRCLSYLVSTHFEVLSPLSVSPSPLSLHLAPPLVLFPHISPSLPPSPLCLPSISPYSPLSLPLPPPPPPPPPLLPSSQLCRETACHCRQIPWSSN